MWPRPSGCCCSQKAPVLSCLPPSHSEIHVQAGEAVTLLLRTHHSGTAPMPTVSKVLATTCLMQKEFSSLISQPIPLKQLSLGSKQPVPLSCLLHQGVHKAEISTGFRPVQAWIPPSGLLQLPGASDEGLKLVNPLCFPSLGIFPLQHSKENSTINNSKLCLQQWFHSHHSFQHHVLLWSFPRRDRSLFLCTAFLCAAPIPRLRRAVP